MCPVTRTLSATFPGDNLSPKLHLIKLKVEKCLQPEVSCHLGEGKEFSDYGIRTVCRQQYSYQKLMVVKDKGKEEDVDLFNFPTGCKCFRITT